MIVDITGADTPEARARAYQRAVRANLEAALACLEGARDALREADRLKVKLARAKDGLRVIEGGKRHG